MRTTLSRRLFQPLSYRFKSFSAGTPPTPDPVRVNPKQFSPSSDGSGIFGEWILDSAGLPAYEYTLDQHHDLRARYTNSEDLDRRDHWFQLGNDRVTGLVSNDGVVQVYLADRGGIFLNHYDNALEKTIFDAIYAAVRIIFAGIRQWLQTRGLSKEDREQIVPSTASQLRALSIANRARKNSITPQSYVGGFAYVDNGQKTWATAYRYRPDDAQVRRTYGIGYFETSTTYERIEVQRVVYAPPGDDPVMIADVTVKNLTTTPQSLRYYEYWDVNIHQMRVQWIRTGAFAPIYDSERRALNGLFPATLDIKLGECALRFHQATPENAPPREQSDPTNWYPPDVFLADLSGTPDQYYRYTDDFFGSGDAYEPEAVSQRRDRIDRFISPAPLPYCMVIRRDLHLEVGQTVNLRFAYGAANRADQSLDFVEKYRKAELQNTLRQYWKQNLAYFSVGSAPALQREVAWHAYSLLSSTVYNEFFNVHLTPQGSAYLFLHGVDGVPRDYALFSLALTYLRPTLAKDMLRIIMQMRDPNTRQIAYSVSGHGHLSGGDVHDFPSDLDLFFLLAIQEYLAATGDTAFLDEQVRLYSLSAPQSCTVLEHIYLALQHLMKDIGCGEHGLLRIRSGDWSDGVVVSNVLQFPPKISKKHTVEHGESIPNTQMALYVLPRTARFLEAYHPELAADITTFTQNLETALKHQWNGKWYQRAILRDYQNRPVVIGDKSIDLESQPWGLISGIAERQGVVDTLIESIDTLLDRESPIGAPLAAGGSVWPAISQLLTWGYARYRPDLAWRSFCCNTFLARATTFPHVWFNIWSGPDGVYSVGAGANAGGTWVSPATPITDFPAMNNNQHAMSLLALLRVCGIEPLPDSSGLRIAPHTPNTYALDLPLLKLEVDSKRIKGEYRPVGDGKRTLHLQMPSESTQFEAYVGGQPVLCSTVDGAVVIELQMLSGNPIPFEVIWR